MSMTVALGFAARAAGDSGWDFNTQTLPGTTGMQNGLSYFFVDASGAKELMRQIYAS
jgi:anionic cell wall polymer biosynthesis LytR-Cps2A-Psr (LCP) family protein